MTRRGVAGSSRCAAGLSRSDGRGDEARRRCSAACVIMTQAAWVVYIVECADGTLYTGIASDVQRRVRAHNAGTGARYTRGRGPVRLVYVEDCPGRSAALRREHEIKKLPTPTKRGLVASTLKRRRE
jgi:putative endonuclease